VLEGDSFYFAAHNRGKRSVILDLKSVEGRRIFHQLAGTADIVVTNYSAGVPDRLGIGYDDLRSRNGGIIFVHITGFGSDSPYRDRGAYDGVIQAMSGVPSLTGPAGGEPILVGAFVADHLAATQAALGALIALQARSHTGSGQFVGISMLEGYMSTLAHHVGSVLEAGNQPSSNGNQVPTAFANTFRASDGFVYAAPLAARAWEAFCDVIDAPEWLRQSDRRWVIREGRADAEKVVENWTIRRTRQNIVEQLSVAGVPCGPVHTVREAVTQPALAGCQAIQQVFLPSGRLVSVPAPEVRMGRRGDHGADGTGVVPGAGEHTEEVLRSLGYSESEIAYFFETGVAG